MKTNNQPNFKKGDSPVVDMLAIPDDHVWPVEWRKIEDDEYGVIYSNGNSITGIKSHATHYLTEADLLKLPFQK